MKIDILDVNKLVSVNKLREITTQNIWYNKMEFDPDGIMSNEIFGVSEHDRRFTYAYVDLGMHFLHPFVYTKVLKPVFRNIIPLVDGRMTFSVKDGKLVKDENGWTGLSELYNHWDEIDWMKLGSSNSDAITILSQKSKDDIFITKFVICPPFYRDIKQGTDVDPSEYTNSVNELYRKLLRYKSMLGSSSNLFSFVAYAPQAVIQNTLEEIYTYFKSRIKGKFGLLKRYLMGKSTTYGARMVISAPNYYENNVEDNMVDMEHCALPLSAALDNFHPFIVSYVKDFFTNELINRADAFLAQNPKGPVYVKIHNPEIQFSEKVIEKMINNYVYNPDGRFEIITVDFVDPDNESKIYRTPLYIKGRRILDDTVTENEDGEKEPNTEQLHRQMTVTDLLYLAAHDAAENRHLVVSRYPVGTDKGIFFNKVRIQTTIEHDHVIHNGREYKYFPKIDLEKAKTRSVKTLFVDTVVFANSYLAGLGGDYDGDQVSVRGLWSDEANAEANLLMNSKLTALNSTGTNSRVMAKEVFNTCYELTKLDKGRELSPKEQEEILTVSFSEMTRDKLFSWFANTMVKKGNNSVERKKARFNTFDTISLPPKFLSEKDAAIKTTIGRFVFNRYILEGSGIANVLGFQNSEMGKDGLTSLDMKVGDCLMADDITRQHFNQYTDRRDMIGLQLNAILAHTISPKMAKPLPAVEKRKKELIKEHAEAIANKDITVMKAIEKELVELAKKELEGDPGMDLYKSGDLNFANNYKNNSIIKGPVINKLTGEFDFIASSFMDGIEIQDLPAHANSVVAGVYPGSIKTGEAGYMGKKLVATMQMVSVDEPGTDCGTKRTIPIQVIKRNAAALVYKYFVTDDGQLAQVTPDNYKDFIGKTLNFRSPETCINSTFCSICASEAPYKLGTKNLGLQMVYMSHADLNLGLKAKHDTNIKLHHLDLNDIVK